MSWWPWTEDLTGVSGRLHKRRYWLLRARWLQVVIHHIVDDDLRAMHDHPWWSMTVVLRGLGMEHTPELIRMLWPGVVVLRRAEELHRITVGPRGSLWTLFITGPERRVWGYKTPHGWVPWDKL